MSSQEAPSFPNPLSVLWSCPCEKGSLPGDWGCSEPLTPSFQHDLYDRVSPAIQGLKRCHWNQNCIQMVHLTREAGAQHSTCQGPLQM